MTAETMTKSRTDEILDFAEREMRKNGFDAVSFRDIASAVGIKSASVHYHYPTKADLGEAVTKRYAERFVGSLGAADDPADTVSDRMARLADAYITAYDLEGSACLCTVLGSVEAHLPESASKEVKSFYRNLSDWIASARAGAANHIDPGLLISILQGAMVLAIATGDRQRLVDARAHLMSLDS